MKLKIHIIMFDIGIGCDLDLMNMQLHFYSRMLISGFYISDKLNQGEGSVSNSVVGGESGADNSNKDTGKKNIKYQKVFFFFLNCSKCKLMYEMHTVHTCMNY